jgi:alpha-beta hydrolase superfamily lysophospholipase
MERRQLSWQRGPWNPEQTLLLPPSPVDWLPENHLVFFLLDLAAELDLEAIHNHYRQKDPRGEKAYERRPHSALQGRTPLKAAQQGAAA